ncbi:hypothetical protein K456DRAFT_266300 [Colletotrichum gloeosporioides 23]|nr:hypothetical protein K456DRAFT_266300 [Colletotrichum gloeosporioides 23]
MHTHSIHTHTLPYTPRSSPSPSIHITTHPFEQGSPIDATRKSRSERTPSPHPRPRLRLRPPPTPSGGGKQSKEKTPVAPPYLPIPPLPTPGAPAVCRPNEVLFCFCCPFTICLPAVISF